jgi:hypothetical protein
VDASPAAEPPLFEGDELDAPGVVEELGEAGSVVVEALRGAAGPAVFEVDPDQLAADGEIVDVIPLGQIPGEVGRAVALTGLFVRIDVEFDTLGRRFSVGHGGKGPLPRGAGFGAASAKDSRNLPESSCPSAMPGAPGRLLGSRGLLGMCPPVGACRVTGRED